METQLGAVCSSGDDYASSAKPQIDWEDPAAREALIDSRARDAHACLAVLDGMQLGSEVQAATLLATVVGQDLETSADGGFRIVRRVAPDRIISTVDPCEGALKSVETARKCAQPSPDRGPCRHCGQPEGGDRGIQQPALHRREAARERPPVGGEV